MPTSQMPTTLPPEFYKYFWEIDPVELNPSQHAKYVINRLLDKGNLEAARWVRSNFSELIIIDTIKTQRDFSFKTITLWADYYNIPKEEIKCIQEPYRSMRKKSWHN
ncbi:hypothetical protein HY409_03745 [Candidatus Gottesmanbacteria bacterium]|nr:hypothetical protein [Candidatus Gottesmanbacteria bacterium]